MDLFISIEQKVVHYSIENNDHSAEEFWGID
jgi:hypothetical protein